MSRIKVLTGLLVIICLSSQAFASWTVDIEGGGAFSGYNDVQIPRETGTRFSLVDDLKASNEVFYRARIGYAFNDRHSLSVLVAPLRIDADGVLGREVFFEGVTFPAETRVDAIYRFDSYRLTYRYDFDRAGAFRAGIGFTAKIRDAEIVLEGDGLSSQKTNTGFVPLIHFRALWLLSSRFSLLADGDALAAPQGRAEDVALSMLYYPSHAVAIKAGYRILEGGADVDAVYNFALVHYVLAGVVVSF